MYSSKFQRYKVITMMVCTAIAAPLVITVGLPLIGFTSGGIAAGSAATGIMSSHGGTVVSGSLCSIAQSVGAMFEHLSGHSDTAMTAAVAGGSGHLANKLKK
ncbi:hypothetical protein HDU92_002879 [Lobulomyces angularis]|nr:hypothetical protein HDU92_002879 [Lobulomyces angularis]